MSLSSTAKIYPDAETQPLLFSLSALSFTDGQKGSGQRLDAVRGKTKQEEKCDTTDQQGAIRSATATGHEGETEADGK